MFYYYGAKNLLSRYYPEPKHDIIVEPFAGSAAYSCYHLLKNDKLSSIICDKDDNVAQAWDFLLNCSEKDILNFPIPKIGEYAYDFYSLENGEDGLSLSWSGRIWLNPPYSNWVPFMEKLKNHGNGIALIFARTETKGFFEHVWNDADSILFLKRRVKFVKADLSGGGSSTAPSVLIAYGENNTKALEDSGIEGKLIKLK